MSVRRGRPDPVMSEAVRRRLEELIAEIAPRRSVVPSGPNGLDGDPPDTGDGLGTEPVPTLGDAARALPGHVADAARRAAAFGREHVAVVAVFGLLAVAYTAFSLAQARTVPLDAPSPTPTLQHETATPTPEPRVLVHVLGAVARPGVVEVTPGARVRDALEAAGGLTQEARPGDLNLAAPVTDGSQIMIGSPSEPGGTVRAANEDPAAGSAGGGATVNLNTATSAQLDTLPGVGPVTAQHILDWRERHGRFNRVEELAEVDGIGPKTLERLAPHVGV